MTGAERSTVVNVGYRSTNYWVISKGRSRLLVDLGWPGTMGMMRSQLQRMDVPLEEIRYGLATHYHMDHAGLGQELKDAGVPLLVIDLQIPHIARMKTWMKPQDRYVEIREEGNVVIALEKSRSLLSEMGIAGEILHTPGHSDDHVSLVLDDGSAFTGDLAPVPYVHDDASEAMQRSWELLRERGLRRIYPGHGPVRSL